jgi:hypothetical protein
VASPGPPSPALAGRGAYAIRVCLICGLGIVSERHGGGGGGLGGLGGGGFGGFSASTDTPKIPLAHDQPLALFGAKVKFRHGGPALDSDKRPSVNPCHDLPVSMVRIKSLRRD